MEILSNKDLFEGIHRIYGHSTEWLTGLASELQVSYNTAQNLAAEAGYYRHKLNKAVSLEQFTEQPYAKFVINKKGLLIV